MSAEPADTGETPAAPTPATSDPAPPPNAPPTAEKGAPEKPALSGAELKKRAKAEKAAKRAQQKAATVGISGAPQDSKPVQQEPKQQKKDGKQTSKEPKQGPKEAGQPGTPLPMRRRQSVTLPPPKEKEEVVKQVGLFGHLYGQPKQHSIAGAAKEVHPAILALGLQYSSYVICGSTARCVSMLLAFKKVIESYTTPKGQALARHLTAHHLSPQITYLQACRPISISMGNAIRHLKDLIVKIDPAVSEADAKEHLIDSIDSFIRERITAADELISSEAMTKITPGDVVLTYASSTIVQTTLLKAHNAGIPFRVIVVDSKPLYEGKALARNLAHHGLKVSYSLISSAAHAMKSVTRIFLGAHAMMSNGRLYSRVGTAAIAMLAHERDIPVTVLCESVKFTDQVALDSIVKNELASPEELLSENERSALVDLLPKDKSSSADKNEEVMKWWRDEPNLQILNILYDVTPAEYISIVITEHGSLPPSSVPVVHRISTNT
ncbi:IF-2B-domain-containing protein [Mytilinidion resinicola]|uniref:Translation initiation factor eIF2B subunit delta n=1 Tax=Mytilinidion resinicola TaxID=574789 RepID=A0A6A6YK59_9PEZI|nr:IF-2B-domain-containing protein [Mytilinidion resinicola]KAF2809201.1 IF-2B-domain-containing protein [Mytilinidion resinicola]